MNDDSCSCLLFLTPIDVLQKSLYPESLPSFSRLGAAGSAFHSGDGDWRGLVWLGNFLGGVSVCWWACGLVLSGL